MAILFAPAKNPSPEGRVGYREEQDWYKALLTMACNFNHDDQIVVTSTNKLGDLEITEAELYKEVLTKEFDIPEEAIIVRAVGRETIGHMEAALRVAYEQNARMMFVYARRPFLQRVLWIAKRKNSNLKLNILAHETFGRPRPSEIKTDWILRFLYPILDVVGLEIAFQNYVIRRRESGIL